MRVGLWLMAEGQEEAFGGKMSHSTSYSSFASLFSQHFLHTNLSAREGQCGICLLKTPTIINRGMWQYSKYYNLKTLTRAHDLVYLNEALPMSLCHSRHSFSLVNCPRVLLSP